MNIWMIEAEVNGKYEPIAMEYSRDQARLTQQEHKARNTFWNKDVKMRIRRYIRDTNSRG